MVLPEKKLYVLTCLIVSILVFLLVGYVTARMQDVSLLGAIIFRIGLPLAAMQTIHMTPISDLAPPKLMAEAFRMWNLVAEIGAVISPVMSSMIRDLTGDWTLAIVLNGFILLMSTILVLFVKKKNENFKQGRLPYRYRIGGNAGR